MDTARTLEEKRERVLEQMRAIRSMRPGSVTEQYLKVTHKGGSRRETARPAPSAVWHRAAAERRGQSICRRH